MKHLLKELLVNQFDGVAPRAGAWIETPVRRARAMYPRVAPRAGAWIET